MSCKCPKYVAKVPTIRIKRNSAIGLRLLVDEKKNYIISNNYTDQRHIQVDGIIYGCLISVRGTTFISNVTLYKKRWMKRKLTVTQQQHQPQWNEEKIHTQTPNHTGCYNKAKSSQVNLEKSIDLDSI